MHLNTEARSPRTCATKSGLPCVRLKMTSLSIRRLGSSLAFCFLPCASTTTGVRKLSATNAMTFDSVKGSRLMINADSPKAGRSLVETMWVDETSLSR